MRNIPLGINCSFLTKYTIFVLCSTLTFLSTPLLAQDLPPPIVETGEATDVTSSSAILNGKVYGRAPAVWFEYGTTSGSYDSTALAIWDGIDAAVSSISGLSAATLFTIE